MNSFVLKSFKGISDYEDKGVAGAFKVGIDLDVRKTIDSLSCQQALVQEGTGIVTDLIKKFVTSLDGNTYAFGSTGKIYRRSEFGVYTLVYTDADGAITGAEEWYQDNDKTYLFWATATKLHCKEIPGQANWSDVDAEVAVGDNNYIYPKTNLENCDFHTMVQAVGSLLIANNNFVALVGFDGSYTTEALNIFKKNYVKSIIERGNDCIIAAPASSDAPEGTLVQWDTDSLSWNSKKEIKGGAINALVETEIPLAQVGTNGQIYYSDMVNSLPIIAIPGGGYCTPCGVANDGNLALFGIYGNTENRNGIYSYGRKELNQSRTLNLEYSIDDCDEIGAICKVGTDILVSYRSGASYYVKKVDIATKATAYYYSLDLKAPTKFNYMPIWSSILLTTKSMPENCKVEVFYKLDKKGNFIQAKMEGNIAEFDTTGGTEAIFLIGEKAKIFEVEIKLTPSSNTTPEVYKAEIYFE